jgi:hypothetical protein
VFKKSLRKICKKKNHEVGEENPAGFLLLFRRKERKGNEMTERKEKKRK